MAVQEKLYTAEDLWRISHLPKNAGKRFELIEGVIVEMSPTGWLHGDVAMEIGALIRSYVKAHNLGRVTAAETGFSLTGDSLNVLAPDVGFIAAGRIPEQLPDGYVPFAPDLAVEVVSPGNSPAEIRTKIEKYLQYGTQLVWIVYPNKKKVDVYHPTGGQGAMVEFVNIDGTLSGGNVLPGFELSVKDIFPETD